ncbi:hypothetical protein CDL12_20971 [Handroanthus impetiginosus]|uniref:Uncharacterized protein n=1 Tax=Handroanthus impetiginosus TaxID=429701 RepID=A0A2G9GMM0_9LAMI|nr:hypothetical protein CDL12_20971 [Handroanthus impetiginosus]
MGTLSSCSFSLTPRNGIYVRSKIHKNSTECFLCKEVLSKRWPLISKQKVRRLNFVIR